MIHGDLAGLVVSGGATIKRPGLFTGLVCRILVWKLISEMPVLAAWPGGWRASKTVSNTGKLAVVAR